MSKLELVFVPCPVVGHLVSTCKLAESLVNRDQRLCITILIIRPPSPFDVIIDSYIKKCHSTPDGSRIRYIVLPQVEPPSSQVLERSVENYLSVLIAKYRPVVKDAIISNRWSESSPKLIGLVFDMFCSSMVDVANDVGIPSYLFFASGAGFLGFLCYLSVWDEQYGREFKRSDADLKVEAYSHPVPTKALPDFAFNNEGYNSFLNLSIRFKEAKGILMNTVKEFESHAVNALASNHELPPVYTVGFLLDLEDQKSKAEDEIIMKWLEQQPLSSVVFLCFGSEGTFERPQLCEIAMALERSGVRFIWSIRLPVGSETTKYEEILPQGFLERTKNRGIIVCNWAPQVDILGHKATGAFVSHCGWNSTLESLWNGVPMVTWPLYAEQQINAFQLARDIEMAVELRLDYMMSGGEVEVVKADEIEKAIRSIMDCENPVRKRVKDTGEICRKAQMEGGSSFISMGKFVQAILNVTLSTL